MKPVIIKVNLGGTIVHLNAGNIVYYYPKKLDNGKIITVMLLAKGWGIELAETPDQIDDLLKAASQAV